MTLRIAPTPVDAPTTAGRALPTLTRLEHYEIECVIALSAYAVVYRAYDDEARQVVAIKEYLPEALALRDSKGWVSPRTRADAERFELGRMAFVDEAHSLARFDCPSLVRVLRLLHANGTVYRVMRFTPGPTLFRHRSALGGPPAVEDVAMWLEGLLGALSVLHGAQCTHGSVTPSNILLRPGEHPLLLDFEAVCKALVGDPAPNATPAATSCPGPSSDLYALAATLHYGISGEPPTTPAPGQATTRFEPLAMCWQRLHGSLPMPPAVQKAFEALDACLAGDSQRRPQTVSEFRDRLSGQDGDDLPVAVAWRAVKRESARQAVGGCRAPSNPETDTAGEVDALVHRRMSIERLGVHNPADKATKATSESASIGPEPTPPIAVAPETMHEVARADGTPNTSQAAARGRLPWLAGLTLALAVGAGAWWWGRGAASPTAPPAPTATVQDDTPSIVTRDAVEAPTAALAIDAAASAGAPKAAPAATAVARPPARPLAKPAATVAARPAPSDPRRTCGERTGFALYQCMQMQCAKAAWTKHDQCVQLRRSDAVD